MNFAEALRTICGRCKREKGTCKTCPVFAVVEEHDSEEHIEHQLELIRTLKYEKLHNWYIGVCGGYPFQAKVCAEDSPWGINGGRIIKLAISEQPTEENRSSKELVWFERGWVQEPKDNPEVEDVLDALYEYFQNHVDEEV